MSNIPHLSFGLNPPLMNKSKALARLACMAAAVGTTLPPDYQDRLPDNLKQTPEDLERIRLAQERQNRKAAKRASQREYDLYNSSQICHKSATELNDIVSPKQLTQ